MADLKNLKTRIVLTHDEYNNLVSKTLKNGEVVLAKVGETQAPGEVAQPIWMMKIGDGTSTVGACPWLVAPAADVHGWAKKQNLDVADVPTLPISKIEGLQDALDDLAAEDERLAGLITGLTNTKADKVTGATAGNFAGLDVNGNLTDSGKKESDFVAAEADKSLVADAEITKLSGVSAGANKVEASSTNGNIKIDDVETNVYTHPASHTTSEITGLDDALKDIRDNHSSLNESFETLETQVGSVDGLNTTNKVVVDAINEVLVAIGAGGTAAAVTMEKSSDGLVYTLKQGDNTIGTINIPKDMVVTAGEVVTNPEGQAAGTYIKLTLANVADPLYINVGTLVDIYKAKANATQVQIAIDSETREISATIVAGSVGTTELADNAITTAKIADKNVSLAKLSDGVQASLGKADTAAQQLTGTDGVEVASDGDTTNYFIYLADNGVTTAKIADKNVTIEKLSDGVQTSLGKADSALQAADIVNVTNTANSAVQTVTVDAATGLKATKTGTEVTIEFIDDVVFVLDGGTAADLD